MTIDLTQIILAIITLIGAIITRYVVPWLKSKINMNKDKISETQKMLLDLAIKTAVKAAEQLYYSNEGEKKKAYVVGLLQSQGFDVNTQAIDAAIESAVLDLHRELKPNA